MTTAGYVAPRVIVPEAQIYMVPLVPFLGVPYQYIPPLGPTGLNQYPNLFGPAMNIEIEEDVESIVRTGSGDRGPFNMPVSMGNWRITIECLMDVIDMSTVSPFPANPPAGDARWHTVISRAVELLISRQKNIHVCYAIGLFKGRMRLPCGEGGSLVRNVEITRIYPNKKGHILWANTRTGNFDTLDPSGFGPTFPPPIVR